MFTNARQRSALFSDRKRASPPANGGGKSKVAVEKALHRTMDSLMFNGPRPRRVAARTNKLNHLSVGLPQYNSEHSQLNCDSRAVSIKRSKPKRYLKLSENKSLNGDDYIITSCGVCRRPLRGLCNSFRASTVLLLIQQM